MWGLSWVEFGGDKLWQFWNSFLWWHEFMGVSLLSEVVYMLLFTTLWCYVDICDYYIVVNGHVPPCTWCFILYSVVGFLVLSLSLVFIISWFLIGFQLCSFYNDVFPGCSVESEHLTMVKRPKHVACQYFNKTSLLKKVVIDSCTI
jgi:hypothetical protein